MSRRKSEAFTQLIVGLFMIVVIALLGYFTIVVSGVDILAGRSRLKLSVSFKQVGGLKDHDNVLYRGTKVGTVERVVVTPSNLVVVADVDDHVILRQGYRISVCNVSMLGGNYLQLEEGKGRRMNIATTVFRGETPSDWMQDVSKIARTMNSLVNSREMKEIVSNVAEVSAKSRKIADRMDVVMARIERGDGLIGRLTSPEDELYSDIRQSVSNVTDITTRVNRGEGLVGRLFSRDDRLYSDLESAVSNVSAVVARVNRGEGFAGRMLADDKLFEDVRASVLEFRRTCASFDLGESKEDVRKLVAKGVQLVSNLNDVAEKLRKGEGTLGKLANEQGVYDEVEGLIKDCRQIIDNYRDTTPIATFTSVLTGAL